jgi:O-antigen/teichoic acid export membrane protein
VKIGKLKSHSFIQNILILSTGTALSQLILFVSTIVLARIYSKNDYGDLSNFMAIIGIVGSIAALRYELTIMLPQKREDAKNILVLCLTSSFFVALISFCLLFLFKHLLINFFNIDNHFRLIISITLGVFFLGVYNSLENWFNRESEFKKIMNAKLIYSISSTILKILFGVLMISMGLIYGTVAGYIFSTVFFIIFFYKNEKSGIFDGVSINNIKLQFIEYKDFFKYSTVGSVLNTISNIGLPLLISYFYTIELAGIYFFANNIIRQPLGFITSSISQVFKKEASTLYYTSPERILQFTRKIQKNIFYWTFIILLIFSLLGSNIFSLIFGNQWYDSGSLVKYFAIAILLNANYSPISSLADILRKQKFLLYFNFSNIAFQVVLLYLFSATVQFNYMILLISLSVALHYLYIDLYVKRILKKKFHEKSHQ